MTVSLNLKTFIGIKGRIFLANRKPSFGQYTEAAQLIVGHFEHIVHQRLRLRVSNAWNRARVGIGVFAGSSGELLRQI